MFRIDLFYRLSVFPIEMPPLRERREDIPMLVEYFIDRYARKAGKTFQAVNKNSLDLLQSYPWPGNIRELRNVIQRAVILSRGGVLDFDLAGGEVSVTPSKRVARATGEAEPEFLTESELQRRERDNLLVILQKTNWKIKGPNAAAELLGVKTTTLITRMKKMGLRRPV